MLIDKLNRSDPSQLESCVRDFEAAWNRGDRPAISDYLTRLDGPDVDLLLELVHSELEFRLRAGESVRVEEYLDRYPALASDARTVLELLAAEHEQRKRWAGLTIEEYLQRFPHLRPELLIAFGNSPVTSGHHNAQSRPGPLGGRHIDRFELMERLGSGASGTVYSARDPVLRRVVALKVLESGRADDRERFLREARSVAPLTHPGIVPLLEAGWTDEHWFLAYEYVPGKTFSELLLANRPEPRRCAELVAQVADALEHAHRKGIVHRDIKPSNILLSPEGQPRLTDFGLARGLGDATLTAEGQLLGTPAYMSPEQARGQASCVDGRSDLYSLGVVLFQLLTGELPFRGSPVMVLEQVLHEEPPPPRKFDERIPRDLASIVLKAMSKSPADRYASAGDLAIDLRRFLDGRPVAARPPALIVRLMRRCRRNPAVSVLAAVVLSLTVLGFAGITAQWQWADRQRLRTEAHLAQTSRQRNRMHADFQRAHQMISTLVTQLSDSSALRGPAVQDAFRQSLELCLVYYQASVVEADSEADPELLDNLASALNMSAVIQQELGRPAEALDSRRRAVEVLERLYVTQPANPDRARTLAFETNALSHALFKADRKVEATKHAERAVTVARQAMTDHPKRADLRYALGVVLVRLARCQRGTPRKEEALTTISLACEVQECLVGVSTDPMHRESLAETHYYAAEIHRDRGDWATSLCHGQRAVELFAGLMREAPDTFRYIRPLGNSSYLVGWALRASGQRQAAAASYTRAAVQFARLAKINPADRQVRWNLAFAHRNAAGLSFQVGDNPAALSAVQQSITVWMGLCQDHPNDDRYSRALEETRQEEARYSR